VSIILTKIEYHMTPLLLTGKSNTKKQVNTSNTGTEEECCL